MALISATTGSGPLLGITALPCASCPVTTRWMAGRLMMLTLFELELGLFGDPAIEHEVVAYRIGKARGAAALGPQPEFREPPLHRGVGQRRAGRLVQLLEHGLRGRCGSQQAHPG